MGIIVALLFILVLLCFYFIALLNMKVNRFQKNERKQELLIEEMEASISSFLTEIEDENSRLIDSLKKSGTALNTQTQQVVSETKQKQMHTTIEKQINQQEQINDTEQIVKESINQYANKDIDVADKPSKQSFNAPRTYVKNAYVSQTKEKPKSIVEEPPRVQSIEERVKEMYIRGMTADEIAKQLNRGKTEIVLMLKFQNKTV
ncbi:MAG: hypothetical protein KBT36_08570 [Kurthia sp.]|nr:hypothetical protein [Candidatus Kurthia equi]